MILVAALAAVMMALPVAVASARRAYVAFTAVSVLDLAANANLGANIPVGNSPIRVAISPDGRRAYVTNQADNDVSVLDLASNTNLGIDIPVGNAPIGIAIAPDGRRAYVANLNDNDISVLDLAANAKIGADIPVGGSPIAIAIAPDGRRAYVVNQTDADLSVLDLASNTNLGADIPVGGLPVGVAIGPDGRRAYVTVLGDDDVAVLDLAANTNLGADIPVGGSPNGVAIGPDGRRAYVVNRDDDDVSVLDLAANAKLGTDIPAGNAPQEITIAPDGRRAYVTNSQDGDVSVLDLGTNANLGIDIAVGLSPQGISITPNQSPRAAVTATSRPTGSASSFDGSLSSDADGKVVRYDWDFGDGTQLPNGGPRPSHAYTQAGTYIATLKVSDNEGCSAQFVFTGQTASCAGAGAARASSSVLVEDGTAPAVSSFSVAPRRFAPSSRRTPVAAAPKARRGTAFRYRLSEPATVKISLERVDRGRRAGSGCKKATQKLKRRKRCTRYVRVGTLTRKNQKAGPNTTGFSGRIGRRALRRGRYRATISATDAAANRSRPTRAVFSVIRRQQS